ncbi:GNAT family N-acetyltransferase [Paracoccaceae bacterium Fryx2]|nr:GNAT family N-acetyltransferase [Paracoccaceae bacterium Fryx2]
MTLRSLSGADLDAALDDVARLRITIFRDWPYLYEGSMEYERSYLGWYRASPGALLVGAFDGDTLVGAATGTPMEDHANDFAAAFAHTGLALSDIFYCAESVLLPAYRGQGLGHRFFDAREAHARSLGRPHAAFCSVIRPDDHPARPAGARSHEAFWRKRGYRPLPGVVADFGWRDVGDTCDSRKPLQFWMRSL